MKNLIIIILLIALIPVSSCKKILEVGSTRAVSEENMWNTIEDARAALIGMYALNRAAMSDNVRHYIYGDVRMGDFEATTRDDLKAIHNNQLKADLPLVNDLSDWRRFYAVVNATNIFIERSHEVFEKDARYTEQNYNVDIAQAKAMRAFAYFYMVRIWGDVPLILSSHDGDFINKVRDPQSKVLGQAEQDLLAAYPKLPMAYDGLDPEQTGLYYGFNFLTNWDTGFLISKQGVWCMLSYLYAWKGDYANTARYAQLIMDRATTVNSQSGLRLDNAVGTFPLTPVSSAKVFRGSALTETRTKLFAAPHNWRSSEFSFTGTMEELTLAQPLITNRSIPQIYVPKDSLLAIYNETGDGRFGINPANGNLTTTVWFTGFDKTYPIFHKIVATNDQPTNTGLITYPIQFATYASITLFSRLDDMGLLLAEAKAALNDVVGATEILNKVRVVNGLTAYDPAKNGSILDAIFSERRRELIGEGWRWYDIIRYKKLKNNDPAFNALIAQGGIYWPIARDVLNQNPLLTQYPYWQ